MLKSRAAPTLPVTLTAAPAPIGPISGKRERKRTAAV
jgi:hypothetical protein